MNLETRQDDRATAARASDAAEAAPAVAPDDLERPIEQKPVAQKPMPAEREDEALAPLFTPELARDFRASWDAVQIGFVDDPKQAVRKADELVRQVLEDLGQTFSTERAALDEPSDDTQQTERLRMALRRYRSFLQRLLSL